MKDPLLRFAGLIVAVLLWSISVGCGGSVSTTTSGSGPVKGEYTTVIPLLSSSANDLVTRFQMTIESITLTNKAGDTINVLSTPQELEFIGLNGTSIPLAEARIPQDDYSSASVTYSSPSFTCLYVDTPSNGVVVSNYGAGNTRQNSSVNVASPLTISGSAINLSLNLVLSQSITLSGCQAGATYSINPTFNAYAQEINDQNDLQTGIDGRIVAINESGNGFTLFTGEGVTGSPLSIVVNSDTRYYGIAGLSELTQDMFIDMDINIQRDGALLATRIAVADKGATNMSIGSIFSPNQNEGVVDTVGRLQQGKDLSTYPLSWNHYVFNDETAFEISSQFQNLQTLPFEANFSGSSLVAGQNVAISSQSLFSDGGEDTEASTMTLLPQTINGTVSQTSVSGLYNVYNVSLASNDIIQVLGGYKTVLVYADSSVRMLSTPVVGSASRFTGLLFRDTDDGTLRMVCSQVSTGVSQ